MSTAHSGHTASLIRRLWQYIPLRHKYRLALAAVLMIFTSIAELISLSTLLPFLALLSSPTTEIKFFEPLLKVAPSIQLLERQFFLPTLTAIFILAIILTTSMRLVTLWFCNQASASIGSELAKQVFNNTLKQPYCIHATFKTSNLIASNTRDVDATVTAIELFLQATTSFFASLGIVVGLLFLSWQIILILLISFSVLYYTLGRSSRTLIRANSSIADYVLRQQLQVIQEAFGSIRDVILDNLYGLFVDKLFKSDRKIRGIKASNDFISTFPRYAFEGIGYVLIAILGLYYSNLSEGNGVTFATLGVVAVGAQRLLPCLQKIFACWAGIKASSNGVESTIGILENPPTNTSSFDHQYLSQNKSNKSTPGKTIISFSSVCYRYPNSNTDALSGITLDIPSGACIGLIGKSGSGKSTLVDILMFLLCPASGFVSINGRNLLDPCFSCELVEWQAAIAHVPQRPFLINGSFADNIAFCHEPEHIDSDRLSLAAKCAQIDSLIYSRPGAFQSPIGEYGSLLSGGQRQRVGIARALYKYSKLLVLDEATSALDEGTEAAVLRNIRTQMSSTTIFMISHRPSTLHLCDMIYKLDEGKIVASGNSRAMIATLS